MKKILTVVSVACIAMFYACGPSAEDKAAAEKAKADSIAAAEKAAREQDSLADIMRQDSIKAAMVADSTRKADSLAAVKAGKKPAGPKLTKDEKNIKEMHSNKGSSDTRTPEEKKQDAKNLKEMHNKKGSSKQ